MELPLTHDQIGAFIRANTEKVFSTMLDLSIEAGPVAIQGNLANGEGGVIALVGFAGEWSGSGSIRCSDALACSISAKLLLTEFDGVNDEVLDAMGEIANMVVGNFKDDAADKLGLVGLSTPTVIYGNNFQARNWNGHSWTAVPFDCGGEVFEVKICLVPSRTLHETSCIPHR